MSVSEKIQGVGNNFSNKHDCKGQRKIKNGNNVRFFLQKQDSPGQLHEKPEDSIKIN